MDGGIVEENIPALDVKEIVELYNAKLQEQTAIILLWLENLAVRSLSLKKVLLHSQNLTLSMQKMGKTEHYFSSLSKARNKTMLT
jgi:hypothetical protein